MADCGSCGAEIRWALTVKGKAIPLDPGTFDDGNIVLVDGVARVVAPGPGQLRSHFVSCPQAAEHRRS